MTDTVLQLLQSASAVFGQDGVATVYFRNGETCKWEIKLINVSTASTLQTKCVVCRGDPDPRNQVDYTRTGNGDTSNTDLTVYPGDYISVQWTGGDSGTVATARIEGNRILKGKRAY